MDAKLKKDILNKLNSKNKGQINEAIVAIRDNGNENLLNAAFGIFESADESIQGKISELFNDLKDQKSVNILIQLVKACKSRKAKKMLLSACWQNRLDYIDHIEFFIDNVLAEEFELSFEAFTVIENMESKVNKERKEELILYVKGNISNCLESNQALAHDIVGIIEKYEEL